MKINIRRQRFDLEAHLIVHAVRTKQAIAMFAANAVAEQAPAFRLRLIGRGGDLGQEDVPIFPGNDMPGARDPDNQFKIVAFNLAYREDVEELGVKGPAIKLEDQIADPRP